MSRYLTLIAFLGLMVGLQSGFAGGKPPVTIKDGVLADSKGMSLYTFDKDSAGKSTCDGGCAKKWPAVKAEAGATAPDDFTVISRGDGSRQWAHGGKPLYYFAGDEKPGEKNGDGAGGVWHIATGK